MAEDTEMSARDILKRAGYSESHWGKIIITAEINDGIFTDDDKHLSRQWTTCACGELDKVLLKTFIVLDGELVSMGPWDKILRDLGLRFMKMVNLDQPEMAATYLVELTHRAIHIMPGRL